MICDEEIEVRGVVVVDRDGSLLMETDVARSPGRKCLPRALLAELLVGQQRNERPQLKRRPRTPRHPCYGARAPATSRARACRLRRADVPAARNLAWLRDELGDRFLAGLVLHTGPRVYSLGDRLVAAPISAPWTD